ncbi:hypothetical protein KW460_16620 [Vibrio fluvialis]|nr:hypothetical protein [Vibrio sp. Vb0888]ELB2799922.1 hypothetical protein [Vibrio alginolyticus]MBY7838679.1 hypothetical protein [Vibrio fluvialis]MDW1851561.1 hypothetical protein [Vibrio sp. Vb0888]
MTVLQEIKNDLTTNKNSGFLCKCIFITYRIGRNTKLSVIRKIITIFHGFFSMLNNCSVPYACEIGGSVLFKHGFSGVFLSSGCKIGDGCTILHGVTIGSQKLDKNTSPILENGVLVGAGAVIVGNITVGMESKIAPNSFVNFDVLERSIIFPKCTKIISKK